MVHGGEPIGDGKVLSGRGLHSTSKPPRAQPRYRNADHREPEDLRARENRVANLVEHGRRHDEGGIEVFDRAGPTAPA